MTQSGVLVCSLPGKFLDYSDSVAEEAPSPSKHQEERLVFLVPFLVIFLILSCFSPSTKVNGKDRRRKRGTVKRSVSNAYSSQNPGVRFYSATEPNLRQNFSINTCRINNHQGTLSSQILKAACG